MGFGIEDVIINQLLEKLGASDREVLVGLKRAPLQVGQILEAPGTPVSWVYFIESGLVSIVAATSPKHRIEVGMIGREGMTGSAVMLGDDRTSNECIVQSAGEAFRISASDLSTAMLRSPRLVALIQRYLLALITQVSHTAFANGRGRLRERVARSILMWQDRHQKSDVVVTHSLVARALAVRRAGVTDTLHELEGRKLIKASRTLIQVLDRKGLKLAANGLYGVPESEYVRLLGSLAPSGIAQRRAPLGGHAAAPLLVPDELLGRRARQTLADGGVDRRA